jgi:HEAT repeat protein
VRSALSAVAACAIAAACGGGGGGGGAGPPPVLAPAGPRLPPPPSIDPGARGAAYLAAIAEHVQPAWAQFLEDCRLRLPKEHPLNAPHLAATAELAIARDGGIVKVGIVQGSGNADFDRAAAGVLADVAPLPRPPSDLESDDGVVHVRWLFARDRRQAGPATARVVTVELPLLGVVERLLERGALARAAHRILQDAAAGAGARVGASEAERLAAAERVMIAALREGLASTDGGVRRAAVEAVGRARVQALAGQIHLLLISTVDVDLRLAAIAAAAALGDPAAPGAGTEGAGTEGAGTEEAARARRRAAEAILADYRADLASRRRVALEKTAALVKLGRAADVAAAIRAELEAPSLDGAPPAASGAAPASPGAAPAPGSIALAALALAPDPSLAPQLAAWFQRGDARVRADVCAALPASAPAQALQLLGRGLRDADATVRAACADAAARVGGAAPDAQLVRRLRELARDRDHLVRARAVAALAVLDPAVRIRVQGDPAAEVRAAGTATATEAELRALAGDRDADVRAAAIARLGGRAPELLARAATDGAAQVRRAAAAALADDAVLERLAHDDSPEVATAAQVRLALRRGRAAITIPSLQRIITAASGGPERVRIALAWLLAR